MNSKHLKLAARFLKEASDSLSNNTCNDWAWPDDWTPEERREFALLCVTENVNRPADKLTANELEEVENMATGDCGPADFVACGAISRLLKRRASLPAVACKPICCPGCGCDEFGQSVEWEARSLEPQDPNNVATLTEYQCQGCGQVFWF